MDDNQKPVVPTADPNQGGQTPGDAPVVTPTPDPAPEAPVVSEEQPAQPEMGGEVAPEQPTTPAEGGDNSGTPTATV